MPTPSLGMLVGGKYRVLGALGAGGMGTVYEAENELTHKRAALKWLHPHVTAHEQAHGRVLHEARASARIRHRNVVDVYDVLTEGDSICLVMELLEGVPLSECLAGEPLAMHTLVRWLVAVMHGVAAVHAVGVVHRDLKPENIFLAHEAGYPEPVPKVIDFGISKIFESGAERTHSGISMGTPKYASYEQLIDAREVDQRTDIYALGVILYEALTGRPPYETANSFSEQAVRFATTVPFPAATLRRDAPTGLAAAIDRAIAKDRSDRFATIGDFIEALRPFALEAGYATAMAAFPRGATAGTTGAPLAIVRTEPTDTATPVGELEPRIEARPWPGQPNANASADSAPALSARRSLSTESPRVQRRMRVALLVVGLALAFAFVTRAKHAQSEPKPKLLSSAILTGTPGALASSAIRDVLAAPSSGPSSPVRAPPQAPDAPDARDVSRGPGAASRPVASPFKRGRVRPIVRPLVPDASVSQHLATRASEASNAIQETPAPAPSTPQMAESLHRAGRLQRTEF